MSGMHRDRLNRSGKFRKIRYVIQICSAVFFNGYIAGLRNGRIFTGKTKLFCVPVLNCYSCPAALGACPIGSLQAVLGTAGGRFPFYVLGILMLFGVILGRAVCGLLCPFGLLQDLLSSVTLDRVSAVCVCMAPSVSLLGPVLLPCGGCSVGEEKPWILQVYFLFQS